VKADPYLKPVYDRLLRRGIWQTYGMCRRHVPRIMTELGIPRFNDDGLPRVLSVEDIERIVLAAEQETNWKQPNL